MLVVHPFVRCFACNHFVSEADDTRRHQEIRSCDEARTNIHGKKKKKNT